MEKRGFEGSKTPEEFSIVSNSETEKNFQISKTDSFLWKTFSVSELVIIGNSFNVFGPLETIFLFQNLSKAFVRPSLKPVWVCEHLKVFWVGFQGERNILEIKKSFRLR